MGGLARDVMSREVICVRRDMDLRDLTRMFLEQGIGGAPVVDEAGDLVGVISQRDLLYYTLSRGDELVAESDFYHQVRMEGRRLPRGFQVEDANSGRVADVMTPVVHSVLEATAVDSVARMMTRRRIHRAIVRKGRKVVGIISVLDLLRHYSRPTRKPAGTRPAAKAKTKPAPKRSRR